ncbi:MAG: hypothetical protein K2Q12_10830 [Rickettsiales bacterium]|nr:hypothetical protein [Rickettsiales bacterium]
MDFIGTFVRILILSAIILVIYFIGFLVVSVVAGALVTLAIIQLFRRRKFSGDDPLTHPKHSSSVVMEKTVVESKVIDAEFTDIDRFDKQTRR